MSFENMINNSGESDGLESSNGGERNGFPTFMWLNGDPGNVKLGIDNMEYVGGFFMTNLYRHNDKMTQYIPDDADKDAYEAVDLTKYGLKADYFVNSKNKEVHGGWIKNLEASFICARECWVVVTGEGADAKFQRFTDYNEAAKVGSPRGQQQVLCLIKGMEELGPIVLSFKGYAMKSFKGQGEFVATGVLSQLKRNVIDPIAKALTKPGGKAPQISYRSVWCKFGPGIETDKKTKKEAPVFVTAGKGDRSKLVVVPSYCGPVFAGKIEDHYVGDAIHQQATEIFEANQEWANAWKNLHGETERSNGNAEPAPTTAKEEAKSLAQMAESAGL